jgi:SWI/SNF-related matrix-associated actin-dependent regulator of chromatin subfamily A member 5
MDGDDSDDVEMQAFEEASDESEEGSISIPLNDSGEKDYTDGEEISQVECSGYNSEAAAEKTSVHEDAAGMGQRLSRKTAANHTGNAKGGRSHGTTLAMVKEAAEQNVTSLIRFHDVLEPFVTASVHRNLLKGGQGGGSRSDSFPDVEEFPLLDQPPSLVRTCKMRDYQLKGMSWLVSQHEKRINSILADEMGLGKTLQTISFLSYILHVKCETGPCLVVVPLSVLFNWMQEFTKWCPSMKVQRFHTGDDEEVARLKTVMGDADRTDVIITTYDTVKGERTKRAISGLIYNTVILDEGHRIKNADSIVAIACANLRSTFRLILTGTPVQNNLRESWSLLNYLSPRIFTDSTAFDSAFNLMDQKNISIDREVLDRAHYLMRPFVLRRLKSEVEQKLPPRVETKILCPMSSMQKVWIQRLLFKERGSIELMGQVDRDTAEMAQRLKNNSSKLRSLLAQLRKASNHPYLFDGVEKVSIDGLPSQEIVTASGKMVVFERLLEKLLQKGHRCVVFQPIYTINGHLERLFVMERDPLCTTGRKH